MHKCEHVWIFTICDINFHLFLFLHIKSEYQPWGCDWSWLSQHSIQKQPQIKSASCRDTVWRGQNNTSAKLCSYQIPKPINKMRQSPVNRKYHLCKAKVWVVRWQREGILELTISWKMKGAASIKLRKLSS